MLNKTEQSDRAPNPNEKRKLLLLGTAKGVRPVPTLLYAMAGGRAPPSRQFEARTPPLLSEGRHRRDARLRHFALETCEVPHTLAWGNRASIPHASWEMGCNQLMT
jgi:hypothetical protein